MAFVLSIFISFEWQAEGVKIQTGDPKVVESDLKVIVRGHQEAIKKESSLLRKFLIRDVVVVYYFKISFQLPLNSTPTQKMRTEKNLEKYLHVNKEFLVQ